HRLLEVLPASRGRIERPRRLRGRAGADRAVTSSANLELVRSIYAAFERGDFSAVEWAHREIEFVIADGPDPSVSTGLVGMLEGGTTILDAWEDWRPEVEEYRELTASVSSCSPDVARAAKRAAWRCGPKE